MMSHSLKDSLDNQKDLKTALISHLSDLKSDICSTFTTAEQLSEIKEQNGRLQEKIENAESALLQVNTERENLRALENNLREKTRSLEDELTTLRREMEAQSHGYSNEISALQVQLEATASSLEEASEQKKAREAEVQSLISDLGHTKSDLEKSESLVATLQEEKIKMEKDAREVEQKIREELARATLKSKDHSRALFEQEQHKLMREKRLAEQDARRAKEQLEMAKNNFVCRA